MNTTVIAKALVIAAAVGACLFLSGGALAAAGDDPAGEFKDLLYRFMNFGLLVVLLAVAARKVNVKAFFAARREGIRERLKILEEQKEAADLRCRELEAALEAFESERVCIVQKFRAEGEAERDRIIAEARETAREILSQADMAVRREIRNAERLLRGELTDSVAAKAQELIAGAMTDKDQEFLVDEFIKRVERLH